LRTAVGGGTVGRVANVTIKDIDDGDLGQINAKAGAQGLSTQEYLRRLIAREAALPMLPDELRDLAARRRAGRQPLTMEQFEASRQGAWRA
jgi:hypothetical protein